MVTKSIWIGSREKSSEGDSQPADMNTLPAEVLHEVLHSNVLCVGYRWNYNVTNEEAITQMGKTLLEDLEADPFLHVISLEGSDLH